MAQLDENDDEKHYTMVSFITSTCVMVSQECWMLEENNSWFLEGECI